MFDDPVLEVAPALGATLLLGVEHVGGRAPGRAKLELPFELLAERLPLDDLVRHKALQQLPVNKSQSHVETFMYLILVMYEEFCPQ